MEPTTVTQQFRRTGSIGAVLLLLATSLCAFGQADRHIFWEVKGRSNTVYLLGSVHMLKPDDSALPAEVLQAYDQSKSLVMELDLNSVDGEALLGTGVGSTTLPEDQTLKDVLGPELHASLVEHAKSIGLEAELLDHFQPWFAALVLEQTALAQSGMESGAGIDEQFAQRAREDDKPIIALETAEEQLGFFARLSMEQQRQYLQSTLNDLNTEASDAAVMVRAWQRGDTAELERLMRKDSASNPELFRMLTTDRNLKWLPKVTALLRDDRDYLVIVGALHLVGNDGLVELLKRQGFAVVQR